MVCAREVGSYVISALRVLSCGLRAHCDMRNHPFRKNLALVGLRKENRFLLHLYRYYLGSTSCVAGIVRFFPLLWVVV